MSNARPLVLFVDGLWVEKFGIMSLIPPLERAGFQVELLLTRNHRRLLGEIGRMNPDYVAFSVTTGYHLKALAMAQAVKESFPQVRIILGGPHVTYYPEVAAHPAVDIAVRGECDLELPTLLRALADGADPASLTNMVVAEPQAAGAPVRLTTAPLAPLVEDLDSLPLPDRAHYYRHRFFRHSPYRSFIVSRGCPHNCTFCFNRKLRTIYKGNGRFVRLRSPESVVAEALAVKRRYGMKLASFEDDLLTHDLGWLESLLVSWRREVAVPLNLNATAQALCNEELVRLLKESGVWCVAFGVECGNETLRSALLGKKVSNEQILRAGELLRRHRLRFLTYNMFALPGESFDDAVETLRLNRKLGTDLARCTLFQPYPGTELGDSCGAVGGEELLYHSSPLTGEGVRRIERLQKLALAGMSSKWSERLAVLASRVPVAPAHQLVFWITYFDVVRRYMKTGYRHLLELGIRSLTDLH